MNSVIKKFLHRGLIFSVFGPLVYAIVMLIIDLCNVEVVASGIEIFKGVISTYLLAFIVSGASVIWEVEKIGLGFSVLIHGSCLYICYLLMYLINGWLKDDLNNVLFFSLIFLVSYLVIWLIIFLIERKRANKFNKHIKK